MITAYAGITSRFLSPDAGKGRTLITSFDFIMTEIDSVGGLPGNQHIVVIISSSDSTDRYEEYLQEGADFILLGEAEQTLADLVTAIDRQENNFLSIPGLAYKQDDAVIKTVRRNVLKDLDSLPFPPGTCLILTCTGKHG
ncbi:MAG: hypothetical protein WDO16_23730 [Bacteroidota bacterium]